MSISRDELIPVAAAFSQAEQLQDDATRALLVRLKHVYPSLEAFRADKEALRNNWDAANRQLCSDHPGSHLAKFATFFNRALRVMCESNLDTKREEASAPFLPRATGAGKELEDSYDDGNLLRKPRASPGLPQSCSPSTLEATDQT